MSSTRETGALRSGREPHGWFSDKIHKTNDRWESCMWCQGQPVVGGLLSLCKKLPCQVLRERRGGRQVGESCRLEGDSYPPSPSHLEISLARDWMTGGPDTGRVPWDEDRGRSPQGTEDSLG